VGGRLCSHGSAASAGRLAATASQRVPRVECLGPSWFIVSPGDVRDRTGDLLRSSILTAAALFGRANHHLHSQRRPTAESVSVVG